MDNKTNLGLTVSTVLREFGIGLDCTNQQADIQHILFLDQLVSPPANVTSLTAETQAVTVAKPLGVSTVQYVTKSSSHHSDPGRDESRLWENVVNSCRVVANLSV